MYDMCTSDLSFWTMVSWSLPHPSCMTCVHLIFPSELWFLGLYLVLHVWHVYIRTFLLNYGFLVSTWSSIYNMCTSDLSFWTVVSWSLPGPSCITCVHHIFPSELWFLGLYLFIYVWHVYIISFLLNYGFLVSTCSFMYDMCTSDFSFWTMVSWSIWSFMYMTCVHLIFPSELWFLGLHLVLHVWHVYIRSFLLNYGFLVSTWSFMYDMCTSDLSFWTLVSWSTWSFMNDMCTSDLSFWTMVSWSQPGSSCMICVHQNFPLNCGFLVSTWSFMYDMCTSELSFWTMVSWSLPVPSWMTCVHQIFPSELWFLGLYLFIHVWHVYIRSFLLNYGFLFSTWSFMYDVCTSDLPFCTMVSWSLPGTACIICVDHILPSELWSLDILSSSCMTYVHQIFPSELWFLGHYLILHVWHVYIRSFLL